MATVPATPLPAQVVLCLGETLPGIGAEFSLAPALKALSTQAVGNSMVAVEMTLTFIVRLVQTDAMPVRPATSESVTTPSSSPSVVPAFPDSLPTLTNEGLKFGNGTPVNMNSEAEITTYNNFFKIKKSPPASRGQLTQWLSEYGDDSSLDFNKPGDVAAFNDHVRLEGCPPASRDDLIRWVVARRVAASQKGK